MITGNQFLRIAAERVGDRYILGALAPKNNSLWTGPWDCAEFVSWVVYQATDTLYGCARNTADPASADAYTGFWVRDARKVLQRIPVEEALRMPGAILLRVPAPGLIGHIAFCDGVGGTIEAHSSKRGVIAGKATGRRWDMGLLVPEVKYTTQAPLAITTAMPRTLRLRRPRMSGVVVEHLQRALKKAHFDPGPVDGEYGPKTAAAVAAFQLTKGLVPDGEAGSKTMKALGL